MDKKTGAKKWNYKQWTILTRTMCLLGGAFLLGKMFTGYTGLVIPGVLLLFLSMIIAAFTLNCPYCGKLISDLLTHNSKKCPHCNKPLEPILGRKEKK